tara:strand:- start:137 stop:268 length:132 start_codon:yes stop_codon:yes gene_type:complete
MIKILPNRAVSKHFDRISAYFLAALTVGLVIQIAPRLLMEVLR